MLIDSVSVAGNICKVYLFHLVDRPFGVLCLQSGIDVSSNIAFQFPTCINLNIDSIVIKRNVTMSIKAI